MGDVLSELNEVTNKIDNRTWQADPLLPAFSFLISSWSQGVQSPDLQAHCFTLPTG